MNENLPTVSIEKAGAIMEAVIAKGDLAQLTPNDRARYYRTVCDSIGLNPLTRPFEYITLNGKLTLYARKDATDQLRKIYGVSVIDMTEAREEGLVIVTVKVRDASGRLDMAKGAVSLKGLQGEALANAFMKCETKAKRRATLSICGLGFLDETEVETVSNAHTPRLPKKDARDIYSRLQAEIDETANIEDWLLKNEGRLLVLPEDWENILRLRARERQQTPPEPPAELWTDGDTPPEWQGSKWDDLGPVKQAGILCSDGGFWKFLNESLMNVGCRVRNKEHAADYVRFYCDKIKSRSELATNEAAAKKWRSLVADYRAWQREPEVVPSSSPPIQATKPAVSESLPRAEAAGTHDVDLSAAEWDVLLGEAAIKGSASLAECWSKIPREHKPTLEAAKNRRHNPTAAESDARATA
jgi:hypothetical protein